MNVLPGGYDDNVVWHCELDQLSGISMYARGISFFNLSEDGWVIAAKSFLFLGLCEVVMLCKGLDLFASAMRMADKCCLEIACLVRASPLNSRTLHMFHSYVGGVKEAHICQYYYRL